MPLVRALPLALVPPQEVLAAVERRRHIRYGLRLNTRQHFSQTRLRFVSILVEPGKQIHDRLLVRRVGAERCGASEGVDLPVDHLIDVLQRNFAFRSFDGVA